MDGFRWSKTNEPVLQFSTTKDEIHYDYTITLEPSELRILPTLEHTRVLSSSMITAYKTDRSIYRTDEPILSRVQYSGVSSSSWSGKTIEDPTQITELPPKTKAWVQEINLKKLDFNQKVQELKKLFSDKNFAYTRQPGPYENLDEFLFDRKLGFCEHYAGAYASLARAIGIPARVITGYQGGEWNSAGEFFRVSHADAHAWAEIRNPKNGSWRRIDPTFWVAPLRIELGGLNYFQLSADDLSLGAGLALQKLRGNGWAAQLANNFEFQIESLNYLWTRTLLGFDIAEQKKLLEILAPKIGWWLAILVGLVLFFIMAKRLLLMKPQSQQQAIETFYWLQKKLETLGYKKEFHEAPVDFLEKIKEIRPNDQVLINKTIQLYRYERYRERKSGPDDWDRIKRAWKKSFSEKPESSLKQ